MRKPKKPVRGAYMYSILKSPVIIIKRPWFAALALVVPCNLKTFAVRPKKSRRLVDSPATAILNIVKKPEYSQKNLGSTTS